MTRRTAAELAAIYGASPRRWPEAATNHSTVDAVEARVDALLDADVPPPLPSGLAERIKASAAGNARAPELPPVAAPRRPARGGSRQWSRGRRILVGAGVANLFLASAVAAAWFAGVPAPVRALLGIESPQSAAPAVVPTRTVTPELVIEAPRANAPVTAATPALEGGRDALAVPVVTAPAIQQTPALKAAAADARIKPAAALAERAADLRRERLAEMPRNDAADTVRDALRDRAERQQGATASSIRDRIETPKSPVADAGASGADAIPAYPPDTATRIEARRDARQTEAVTAPPVTPKPAPAPAGDGEAAKPAVDRPERVDRPPRRLRERLQRLRQRSN